tara:strand:+ start:468 stop:680 length:213 start_codon:yes stop_codon:yes gene_type:complete
MVDAVWTVEWTEHERGYGQRHVSFTSYEKREEADEAIKKHWDSLPDDHIPDTYISPGTPFLSERFKNSEW